LEKRGKIAMKPLGDFVVIKPINVSDGGIILSQAEALGRAEVIAVGPGAYEHSSDNWHTAVKSLRPKQKVLYNAEMGLPIDDDMLIINITNILAIV